MDLFTELDKQKTFSKFTALMDQKLAENGQLLTQMIWVQGKEQRSVLNHFISQHNPEESGKDYSMHIRWLLMKGADINLDQPLHLALKLKKLSLLPILRQSEFFERRALQNGIQTDDTDVADHLLTQDTLLAESDQNSEPDFDIKKTPALSEFNQGLQPDEDIDDSDTDNNTDNETTAIKPNQLFLEVADISPLLSQRQQTLEINARDEQGRTLLSRAIESGSIDTVNQILAEKANVSQSCGGLQPLHEAVIGNFPEAVHALINAGAQIENPTKKKFTPLLLAARHGSIRALEALLKYIPIARPGQENPLDTPDFKSTRAMDYLCARLKQKENLQETIRGIALLLCHGASAPRSHSLQSLLRDHRHALREAVTDYTADKPAERIKFLRMVQSADTHLHEIIFADRTFGTSLNRFFGRSSRTAFRLADMVLSTAPQQAAHMDLDEDQDSNLHLPLSEHSTESAFSSKELEFARFVKLYEEESKKRSFCSLYNGMRFELARGRITTIDEVDYYCNRNPHSLSNEVRARMNNPQTEVHVELECDSPRPNM